MKTFLSAIVLLFASCQLAWTQNFDTVEIRTTSIAGNLHLLQGYGGNIVVSTGKDGTLIVDDEYAPLTDKVKAAVAKLTDQPVKFVINTHWHNDHTGGNETLGRIGAIIIAQENSRKRMSSDQVMSLFGPQAAYAEVGLPKITFTDSVRLHYNDDTIDVIHLGAAHTDGDAAVFFRRRNVLHTGDLFVGAAFLPPYFDDLNGGSLEGMIKASGALAELVDDRTIVVPGHGEPASRVDLVQYQSMLVKIRDRILQAIAAGKSEDDVVAAQPTAGFARPGRGTDRWVRVAYREYKK